MSAEQAMITGTGGYSDAEMIRMQRDAIRRVREMQQRARDFEQARRAAGSPAGEAVIPRPTLTGNPIGMGRVGTVPSPGPSYEAGSPPVPPPPPEPEVAYQPPPVPPPPFGGAYQGAQNAGPQGPSGGRPPQSPGGLFSGLGGLGNLFSGQGIAGVGDSINAAIGNMSEPVRGALSSLGLDNERLLIILVMFIVFTQDDYDNLLLLALGYLLL